MNIPATLNSYTRLPAFLIMLLFSISAFAAPEVRIEIIAEKDVTSEDKKGKKQTQRVQAEDTVPGDILYYTIRYENVGNESATQANINNPVPQGTRYQDNSAWGDNSDILFSIDNGTTFKKPGSLSYEQVDPATGKKEVKQASPEQYNAIRWVISEIPANSKGSVGYSVRVQ